MQKGNDVLNNLGGCLQSLAITFIFLVIGAGLSWWGWTILQNARSSSSWPATQGQITESTLDHSTDAEGGDSYSPEVTYTYQVNGIFYENGTIKFGENSYSSQRKAQEILNRYPVGQMVSVYYDPDKPGRAVLEPGVSGGSYIVFGIGVLFVLISLIPLPVMIIRYLFKRK
ncbi:MAG: DUF3592 domain-containing protein [Anaerolineae bacterium]|nr:DUF3592 domain-containing protein [Anaerolineae bacterium]